MRRIAFIIGSPESAHGYLQGVRADHTNYRAFLTSNTGGAWEHDEIHHLGSPSRTQLRLELNKGRSAEFAFVAFAGHGYCYAANGETYVCINDTEDIPVWEFNTGAPRQVTSIDACRTFLQEELRKADGRTVLGADRSADPYRVSCRRYYDQAIGEAEEGIEILYATSPGQAAEESETGGYFTSFMIRNSIQWAESNRDGRGARAFAPVNNVLESAKTEMIRRNLPQRPVGQYGRRIYHFPFAVA